MRNIATKINGNTLPAAAFNSDQDELENAVLSTDQTLDPDAGPDTDLNMLGKAMAAYGNAANVYQDSGAADAYVLAIASNLKSVTKYYDNMMIAFKAGNSNTGASTVNVNTLGVKSITLPDGTALSANAIVTGNYVIAVYSLSNDRFELIKGSGPIPTSWPSFRATSTGQAIATTAATKIEFDTEDFDTNSDYDAVTNFRFTPTAAGKYSVHSRLRFSNLDATDNADIFVYKNGVEYGGKRSFEVAVTNRGVEITELVDMNGTTDYIEIFVASSADNAYDVASIDNVFYASRIA